MPIHVICEACESEFDVPETLAGKTIKCKSCGEGIAVVAKKTVPAKPTLAKPATKKPVVVDDEDDVRPAKPAKRNFGVDGDEEENDQPRRKTAKAPPAKKKSALPLILAGVFGFLVVGGGLGVYLSGMLDSKPEVVVNPQVNPLNDPRNQANMNTARDTKPGEEADIPEKKPTKTDDTKAAKPLRRRPTKPTRRTPHPPTTAPRMTNLKPSSPCQSKPKSPPCPPQ